MFANKEWVKELLRKVLKNKLTPTGTIISFMGNTAPNGYFACDGTEYNIADYPDFVKYLEEQFGSINYFGGDGETTFAVPDLRGEFLRGTGTGTRNTGSGAKIGVHQDGTEIPFIIGGLTKPTSSTNATGTLGFRYDKTDTDEYVNVAKIDKSIPTSDGKVAGFKLVNVSEGSSSYATASYTSRPTNTSVLYCIKY